MILQKVRAVPPGAWVVVAAAVGLGVLAYHQYAQDDADQDWTMGAADQPPMRSPYPDVPAQHGSGSPMSANPGFRSRAYPGSLADADFSIIGEV